MNSSSAFPQGNRLQSRNGSGTATAAANDTNIRVYIQVQNGVTLDNQKFYPQIEVSSTATSYEPYTGGVPAPNPSYPQTVQTVTGEQTVTISNGDDVQNVYTVDLGNIELAKIGDYQDYIYKSGDDWYVHKECGKVVLDGSQGLSLRNTSVNNTYTYSMDTPFDYKVESGAIVISDHFIYLGTVSGVGAMYNSQYYLDKLGIALYYNSGSPSTQSVYINSNVQLPTWLSTHNTKVYYTLATPTDTKITNQVLIAQLNTLFNASLYQPTSTITTAGNLPVILDVEAFTDNLNSLVEIASEPSENVFVGTNGVNAGVSGLVPAPQATDAGKFLKADGTWASGGGGGTSYTAGNGIDITSDIISVDTSTIQAKLTAGSNVNISAQNVISATDTTYTDFTGTDGNTGGTAGLVPAPTTSDVDKFLKSDGTWATAGGGGGPTVVQTTGTSQTDVMSQNATSTMVYADPDDKTKIIIGAGAGNPVNQSPIAIGNTATSGGNNGIAIGTLSVGARSGVALGDHANANYLRGSVALGAYSHPTSAGEVNIGTTQTSEGYNSSNYRLLTGLYDGQSAHDAVTLGQLDGRVLQNAGAPTTSTVGTVGQLLEDTTNGKLYQCTAIDNTDPNNPSYTWDEIGAGGEGPTVVQTTGTSTTDVMSQNATTAMIYNDPSTMRKIKIGGGASTNEGTDAIEIGRSTVASSNYGVAIGSAAQTTTGQNNVAIGADALAIHRGSVALGSSAQTTVKGQIMVGTNNTYDGYNSTNYRLVSGVHDGQSANDAVNVNQVNSVIDSINSALNTTIPHIGA